MNNTYTTKSGDTWDVIAKEVYGSESYTSYLMENNHDKISYFIFPAGVILKTPALPANEETITFPEWRQ